MGEIWVDIVESGRTMADCRIIGLLPDAVERDDDLSGLHVTVYGGYTTVTLGHDSTDIITRRGWGKAMQALADMYATRVAVVTDPGVGNSVTGRMVGVWEPAKLAEPVKPETVVEAEVEEAEVEAEAAVEKAEMPSSSVRTVTDTADRLRVCDMLILDDTLRSQLINRLPKVVLVEGISACATHSQCINVAVANPHGSLACVPEVAHVGYGHILTWRGDYRLTGSTGFRPGGVDDTASRVVAAEIKPEAEVEMAEVDGYRDGVSGAPYSPVMREPRPGAAYAVSFRQGRVDRSGPTSARPPARRSKIKSSRVSRRRTRG